MLSEVQSRCWPLHDMGKEIFDISTAAGRLTGHVDQTARAVTVIRRDRAEVDTAPADASLLEVWDDNVLTGEGLRKSDLTGGLFRMPLTIVNPSGEDWTFPVEPIISVTSRKIIVKTPMPSLGGTVKEEILEDDYAITIRGILLNEDNDSYPVDQIARLEELKRTTGGLEVINKLLNQGFGIMRMTIEQITYEGREQSQTQQSFVISALSDRPVELVISEGW